MSTTLAIADTDREVLERGTVVQYENHNIGTDPAIHVEGLKKLFDSGVTIVNVHSGQPDQRRVIDFYGRSVLPKLVV